jgi:cardiolipin synthase
VNAANLISLARLLSVPFTVWLLLGGEWLYAFVLFVMAGLSDALDGYLARHHNMQSELGEFLDPLADKVLMISTYVALGMHGDLPVWLVILVVSRDLLIVGGVLLSFAMDLEISIEPLMISKANTVLQVALVAAVLAYLAGLPMPREALAPLGIATALTTAFSGGWYLVNWIRAQGRGDRA